MVGELVKPIVGIIISDTSLLDSILMELNRHFGKTDIVGEWRPFTHTNYYESEMGKGLMRCFVSFEKLISPEAAGNFKGWSKEVEAGFCGSRGRAVNIDPGYIDSNKVVLITGKHGGHKIALRPGVWADMLLWYNKGWEPLPWAFPDFRDGGFFPVFTKIRTRFKQQLRLTKN